MKKVSIIIPVYNQEAYLHRSLRSVLMQTYSEIEVVCVNDGSKDNSLSILREYQKDKRVVVIDQDNGGLIHAVVQGVRNCSGEFLCFLDPDDYLNESFINNAVSEMGEHDFVAFGHFIDDGNIIRENKVDIDFRSEVTKIELQHIKHNLVWDTDKHKLSKTLLNSRWNKMYKTETVKKFINQYDNYRAISFGEDTFFTYLLISHSESGIVVPTINGYYYNTGNQLSMMTNSTISNHLQKAHRAFESFKDLLINDNESLFQAYSLYYFLIESIFQRLEHKENADDFNKLYRALHADVDYVTALNKLILNSRGMNRTVFFLRRYIRNPRIYMAIYNMTHRKGK